MVNTPKTAGNQITIITAMPALSNVPEYMITIVHKIEMSIVKIIFLPLVDKYFNE